MDTYGFTYKGRHCSEFGVRLLGYTVNSPNLREYESEPAGLPGVFDFGTEWGKREIDLRVDIDPDEQSFKRRQTEILTWLKPTIAAGLLVFDDVPDRFFYAKLTGKLSAEQTGNYGELSLTMKCSDPFAYGPEKIHEGNYGSNSSLFVLSSDGSESTPPIIEITNLGLTSIPNITLSVEYESE